MGKYTDEEPAPSPAHGENSSAINLSTPPTADPPMQRYFDDDPAEFDANDLPPLYTEHDLETVPATNPLAAADQILDFEFSKVDTHKGVTYYIDRRLDHDHSLLLKQLTVLSTLPPRPYAHIKGTHRETVRNGDKSEKKQVVDFDIEIELTSLLYTKVNGDDSTADRLTPVSHWDKVRRGTVFATRAPGYGGSGTAEEGVTSAEEWCARYAISPAGLKCFSMERRVEGWEWSGIRHKIKTLIEETGYQGLIEIDFPVRNAKVEIYNHCRTNHWRLTKWIEILCVFTLMFLFTWPYLFFRTKRYETVYMQWYLGSSDINRHRTTTTAFTQTEMEWFNTWGRAIHKAVLRRHQGLLEHHHLNMPDVEPRQEGVVGWVQQGMEAMNAVNRSYGWGGDR